MQTVDQFCLQINKNVTVELSRSDLENVRHIDLLLDTKFTIALYIGKKRQKRKD